MPKCSYQTVKTCNEPTPGTPWIVWAKQTWLAFGASLSFLIMGMVRGYSASAIPSIQAFDPHIIQHSEQKSWIGAMTPLSACLGSTVSGALMERIGRKRTLQLTAPLWAISWVILGTADSFYLVLIGRAFTGICAGFILSTAQVYVSECCDPEIRGRLGSLPTLSMSLGILLSYIAGGFLYWRHLAFFSAIFCVIMFVVLYPLPESPVWLEANDLDVSASVTWLHLSARATATIKEDKDEKTDDLDSIPSLFSRKVFFSSVVFKPVLIGFLLFIFQQFSGIDAVVFFTVEIFKTAGSSLDATTATIVIGVVQLLSNAVSTMLVDRAGRRPLLLISAAIMCASMAAMGFAFYFEFENGSWLGYLPICSLVVFMLGFSLGFGGLPYLLLGELFPAHYRSKLSAMASAVNLLSMFFVIKTYHVFESVLTSAGTFWIYAIFCAIAFFFVLFVVPETKGKSLAEIERYFRGEKTKTNNTLRNSI